MIERLCVWQAWHHSRATSDLSLASSLQHSHDWVYCLCFNCIFHLLKVPIVACLFVFLELSPDPSVSASVYFLLDIPSWSQPLPYSYTCCLGKALIINYCACIRTTRYYCICVCVNIHTHAWKRPAIVSSQVNKQSVTVMFCSVFGQWPTVIIHTACHTSKRWIKGWIYHCHCVMLALKKWWTLKWEMLLLAVNKLPRGCASSRIVILKQCWLEIPWSSIVKTSPCLSSVIARLPAWHSHHSTYKGKACKGLHEQMQWKTSEA